jgi:hypothetical protein
LDPDSIGLADPDWTQSEFNLSPLLLKFAQSFAYSSVAVARSGGGGGVVAGDVITNYGSGHSYGSGSSYGAGSSYGSGFLHFIKDLKKFYRKMSCLLKMRKQIILLMFIFLLLKILKNIFSGKHGICSCRS